MEISNDQTPLAIKAGQCLIIYDEKRIHIKHTFEKNAFMFVDKNYFLGTPEKVDFKIFELGLPDIPFSKSSKKQ